MRNKIVYFSFISILISIILNSCQSEDQITYARYYVNGKGLYEKNCQNCHGADGGGLKKLYPALTDTVYIRNNKERLSCIIKYGLEEKIIINRQVYEEKMSSNTHLTDIDVTQILVYIGNSFGNKLGNFKLDEVSKELKECRY